MRHNSTTLNNKTQVYILLTILRLRCTLMSHVALFFSLKSKGLIQDRDNVPTSRKYHVKKVKTLSTHLITAKHHI